MIKRLQQRFWRKSLHVKKVGYQSLSLPGQSPIHPHRDCRQSWPFTMLKLTHQAKQRTVAILFVCSPPAVPCRPNLFFGTLFWILSYTYPKCLSITPPSRVPRVCSGEMSFVKTCLYLWQQKPPFMVRACAGCLPSGLWRYENDGRGRKTLNFFLPHVRMLGWHRG